MKRKRSRLEWLTIGVIVIASVMFATVPTRERFDTFIAKKHGIVSKLDFMLGETYEKDGESLDFKNSHFRNTFLYASYERNFERENGERITTRTLGVFGMLFEMRDGFWWEKVFN